jgi:acetoin utilization deacetylase AcuC-like enzyme
MRYMGDAVNESRYRLDKAMVRVRRRWEVATTKTVQPPLRGDARARDMHDEQRLTNMVRRDCVVESAGVDAQRFFLSWTV